MVETNLKLKKDIDALRQTLHDLLSCDSEDADKLLKVSQDLDELIARYIKLNRKFVA